MNTFFNRSAWSRDRWSPNMGQAGTSGNPFADIANAAAQGTSAYFQAEKAKEDAAAKEAQAKAQVAAAAIQAQAAAAAANQNMILGMSPSTAAIVGLLGVGTIIAVVMLSKKK